MDENLMKARNAVFVKSENLSSSKIVEGYNWENGINYSELFSTYLKTGFQATHFGEAVLEVKKMLDCRKLPLSDDDQDNYEDDNFIKRKYNCTIFLGYTSNMISSGIRETIKFLVKYKMIDCIVTTAGGIEEDFIKCLAATYIGSFDLSGKSLRANGLNRIGNLLVPNENYCKFEDWLVPLLDEMLLEQNNNKIIWTPSKIIQRLGERINDESSIYYWAAKNNIPVFSPALTDGSLGDIMYFHSHRNPGLLIDILTDLKRINSIALKAKNSGTIILGGGIVKHHICNANLMRNGADFSVFINTGSEYDGSDSGARPDEAISWGKIKQTATPVKIYADASLVFPILVGETFAKYHYTEVN